MIRDITLGQYYPGTTIIHKLDPRVKIIATLVFIVMIFVIKSFEGFAFAAIVLAAVIAVSRVPIGFIMKGLKPVFIIILLTFVLNLFMYDGTILWQWKVFKITNEGLERALFMAARLLLLIIGSSLLTFTTRPISLTDGIEYLLGPARKLGVPAHELAMMMTIALRFIPTLLDETDKIMKAQQARGADFETGSIFRRAKNMMPILVPLFINAFKIAGDMAMAMEARCYRGGEGRTKMNVMKMKARDWVGVGLIIAFVAVIVLGRVFALEQLIGL